MYMKSQEEGAGSGLHVDNLLVSMLWSRSCIVSASVANSGQMLSARLPEKFGRWRKNSAAHTLLYRGWFS
jgi:hypothetical protein